MNRGSRANGCDGPFRRLRRQAWRCSRDFMQAALSWLGVPSTRRLAGLVTHNLTATNRMLMPSQIDSTIRKELAMTPPPAFLSRPMRGRGREFRFCGGGSRSPCPNSRHRRAGPTGSGTKPHA